MTDGFTLTDTFDRAAVKAAVKLVFGTLALLGLLAAVAVLPGLDTVVPGTDVPFVAVADAVVTAAVVGVLVALAPRLATVVRRALTGPREMVQNAAGAAYWLVALVAVLVAHWGFGSLAAALLGDATGLYDLAFLVAALVPLVAVAVRVATVLDPAADQVAEALTAPHPEADSGSSHSGDHGDSATARNRRDSEAAGNRDDL